MIAFEVYINGQKRCTAGVGDIGVLSSLLSWRGRQPDRSGYIPDAEYLALDIGGLNATSDQHVRWIQQDIKVGDEIRIRIVETDKPDARQTYNPA